MGEEKPFEPTPGKILKARKEGNVARSTELNGVASFAVGMLAASAVAPLIVRAAGAWMQTAGSADGSLLVRPFITILGLTAIPLVAAAIAGVTAGIVQTGGPLFVAPSPKLDRLKPDEGFKRMFSAQSLIAASKAMLVFAIAAAVVAVVIRRVLHDGGAGSYDPLVFTALAAGGVKSVLGALLAVAAVFAAIDVFVVRGQWRKKLRMDYYELKRETKESEGDPHVKGRRRTLHRSLSHGSVARVSEASFVVTNPTHVAVALRYAPPEVAVPVVLCMGAGESAQLIRSAARERSIPLVENVPLARMLYETAVVDRTIPRETFIAVAEIVSALTRASETVA